METRADPYWFDAALGNSGNWTYLPVTNNPPWRSFDAARYRVVADTVFMAGNVYNESYSNNQIPANLTSSPAFILPLEARPATTLQRAVPASGAAGLIKVDPDGSLYILHQELSLHSLSGAWWPTYVGQQ